MASGTHAASNGDLAFVARCSVSDLFVASASYDLWCTMIQRHTSSVDIIDSVGRLHQIVFNQCVFQQIKVLIHGLFSQAVHSNVGSWVSFAEGELWLPLHKSPKPPIGDFLSCHSYLITSHRFCQTHNLFPSLPIACLRNVHQKAQ